MDFHPITDKHSNEVKPTRHHLPMIERLAAGVLHSLRDISQPTVESPIRTAHVSCHESGACVILTVKPAGTSFLSVGVPEGLPEPAVGAFDSMDDALTSDEGMRLVLVFLNACRKESEPSVMGQMVDAAVRGQLFT